MGMSEFHGFKVRAIAGREIALERYAGRVALVVNTASECGFTPQYRGLEALHRRFRDGGLAVLGFPCDDFGGQEPGSDAEIEAFCRRNYQVGFDLFSKVRVRSEPVEPLYRWLCAAPGFAGPVDWNFTKFLVGRDGAVLGRWEPGEPPESAAVVAAVTKALAAP